MAELNALFERGADLLQEGQNPRVQLGAFALRYEAWYTLASSAISQLIPERVADFREAYRDARRKAVTYDTYTVSDYLTGLVVKRGGEVTFNTSQAFAHKMLRQIGIVSAAAQSASSSLRDIRTVLQAELLDSDLAAARELTRAGHLRSAGVVCGVVLESHFGTVADRRGTPVKKNPTIGDYNDALKAAGVYDTPTWRLIQRLADIRNLCGHKKEREPTRAEVDDLMAGTDKIIKEVF